MAGIVLLGTGSLFSRVVLERLIAGHVEVLGLGVPGIRSRLAPRPGRQILAPAPTAVEVARAHGLPVVEVGDSKDPEAARLIADLRPDVVAVACFPWLLPRAMRELAPRGALNLHPSLLPAYRGPAPLFWQLHAGETRTGVTLHRIDAGVDTGDILLQADVPFRDGLGTAELETMLGRAGAALLLSATGPAAPTPQPQPEAGASRQGMPRAEDLEIPTSWPARRAFNLIRGAAGFGPFVIRAGTGSLVVAEALGFTAEGGEPGRVRKVPGGAEVGFSPGTVILRPGYLA